jgi:assimilatory nitrate reductase catalytic subunit
MGFAGFDYAGPQAIFDEHARLSTWRNGQGGAGRRMFDLSGLAGIGQQAYEALEPVQWPVARSGGGEPVATARLFADGRFAHPGGRARFVATPPRAPVHTVDQDFPLALNTGRMRDQWHTMTRTGKSPRLSSHAPEPFVDLHPNDALLCGVREGELARVTSRWGAMVARVTHSGGIARGSVFVPIHWNGQTASDARVGALVNPVVDPVSGEPEFKHTPVMVAPFVVEWQAFVLSREPLALGSIANWTRIQGEGFMRYEMAGRGPVDPGWARALLQAGEADDWIDYEDEGLGAYRAAHLVEGRLHACVFVARNLRLPPRDWLAGLFAAEQLAPTDRATLLAGRAPQPGPDPGPTVCSCFGVGRNTIQIAIREHRLATTAQVTACVRAGGNCGSCVPEIGKLLALAACADAPAP